MDILLFTFTDKWWDWQREGFSSRTAALTLSLAEHPGVGRILVVDTPSSFVAGYRADMRPGPVVWCDGTTVVRQPVPGIFVLDHQRMLPRERHSAVAGRLNGLLHDGQLLGRVDAARRALGMRDVVAIHAGPATSHLMGRASETVTVYDAVDEWAAHPAFRRTRDDIRARYRVIERVADLVLAVSPRLAEVFAGARDVRVLPNAVGRDWTPSTTSVPSDLAQLPRPIAGYVGALQQRVDVNLLSEVARRMESASFCLIGPVQVPEHFAALRELSNVHFLGPKDHREVRSYVDAFDVCLVPHVPSRLTECMDPIKLYEYVAAGKPTLVSGVGDTARFGEAVRRADDAEQCCAALREAFSGAWTVDDESVQAFVSRNDWRARVETLLAALGEHLPASSGEAAERPRMAPASDATVCA